MHFEGIIGETEVLDGNELEERNTRSYFLIFLWCLVHRVLSIM